MKDHGEDLDWKVLEWHFRWRYGYRCCDIDTQGSEKADRVIITVLEKS
jgi:hypothetical protein